MKNLTLDYLIVLVLLAFSLNSCEKNEDADDSSSLSGRLASYESYELLDLAVPVAFKTDYTYTDGKLTGKDFYYKETENWGTINTSVEEYLSSVEWMDAYSEILTYYQDSIVITRTVSNQISTDLFPDIYSGRDVWKFSNGKTSEMNSYGTEFSRSELKTKTQYTYEGDLLKYINISDFGNYEYYFKEQFSYQNGLLTTVKHYESEDNSSFSLAGTETYIYSGDKLNEINYSNDDSNDKDVLIYQGDRIIKQENYYLFHDNSWVMQRYQESQVSNNTLIIKEFCKVETQFKLAETSKWIMEEGSDNWEELFNIMAHPKSILFKDMYPGF